MRVTRIRRTTNIGIAALVLLSMLSFSPGVATAAGTTELISVTPGGTTGNNQSASPSVSGDGSLVAFWSIATDLVAGDSNGVADIFVRDRNSGTTERVSVSSSGVEGNADAGELAISADGRYVAFESDADNLVAADENNVTDIFLHDRNTDTTTLISVSSSGVPGNGASTDPSISADGRYIAFTSEATNLVAGDTNDVTDIFVHDRVTGNTERVSIADSSGDQGNLVSREPSISADGRYVAFKSAATNLVPPTATTELQIFVHDRDTGSTVLASRHADGTPGDAASNLPAISGDGRYVAFESKATNLIDDLAFAFPNFIYVHDLVAGTTEMVSLEADGTPAISSTGQAAISFDGRYVAYASLSASIVPDDTNSTFDIFVRDRIAATNERVSVSSAGVEGNGQSTTPAMSADGQHVAFHGVATNLTPEPDDNGAVGLDVFIHDRMQVAPEPAVNVGDDAQVYLGEIFSQRGEFDDPDSTSWTATVDYGEGDGPQPLTLNPDNTFDLSHTYQDIGNHTVTVEVCDDELNCGSDTLNVLVIESPLIVSAGAGQIVEVGETVNLNPVTFTDPDNLDSHTATIDWNDGSPIEAGTVDQEVNEVHGSHVYTAAGVYGVVICVQDNVSLEDCDGFIVTVNEPANQAPEVDAGGSDTIDEGDTFIQNGSFTDPDSTSWTATVDYGDGDGVEPLPLTGMTFQLNHVYADDMVVNTGEVCVTDDGGAVGCDDFVVTINNVAPTVDAGSDQNVEVGETVNLDPATFTDPGALDTHTATIDWGDGSPVEPGTVDQGAGTVSGSHTYNTEGQFTVEVCVTDDDAGEGCDSFTVNVSEQQANQPPIVDLGDAQATGDEGSPFNRNGSFGDADSTMWTATVDYGDGGGPVNLPLAGMNFNLDHTYADNDVYTVTVCVTDDGNETGCDSIPVTISNVTPTVDAGSNQNVEVGNTVNLDPATFSDPGTADTHTATIDWGDGSPLDNGAVDQGARTVSGSHVYNTSGQFTVEVCMADDDAGEGCDSFQVDVSDQQVNQAPIVDLGDAQAIGDEGASFMRNGLFGDEDSTSWTATVDYGDGGGLVNLPLTGMNFALGHTYADNGVYTVEVCVTDDGGAEGCDMVEVSVNNVSPSLDAGSDQDIEVGDTVNLDPASFSDPGAADTHTATIDWGDGSAVEPGTVDQAAGTVSGSHSYNSAGQFTVEICVTDDDGGEGCDDFTVTVSEPQVNQPPIVDLGDAQATGDEGTPFVRNGLFGDEDSTSWTATVDYGDGGGLVNLPLAGMNFALGHTYADNGVYTIEVCVTDDGGAEGCDSIPVTISNVAPEVDAGPDRAISLGTPLNLAPASFTDPGTADTHNATIDWGDGSPVQPGIVDQLSNTVDGSHTYAADGMFTVNVCVIDDDGAQGCDSFEVTVHDTPQIEGHLCVSQQTNLIRMPNGDCGPMQTRLNMPDDLPLTVCASLYTNLLRHAADRSCSRLEWRIDLPDDAPIDVCVSTFTTLVRYVSEPVQCTRYEQHRVIGEPITPPDRGNPR